ncbi:MAG: hypothetical protein D6681_21815 [Calditrichaeota bacterium]|nr:MAG: hypothetical protein D6681_21815 [Calditrichota bacterium]
MDMDDDRNIADPGEITGGSTNGTYHPQAQGALRVRETVSGKPSRRGSGWSSALVGRFREAVAGEPFSLGMVNRLLVLVAVLATAVAPLYWRYDAGQMEMFLRLPPPDSALAGQRGGARPTGAAPQHFSRMVRGRQFFRYAGPRKVTTAEPINAVEVPGLSQRYTLLGVIMGAQPQAIVRENITETSMFLSQGQQLGGYRVMEISEGRIILQRGKERVELRM